MSPARVRVIPLLTTARCLHCAAESIALPATGPDTPSVLRAFATDHAACELPGKSVDETWPQIGMVKRYEWKKDGFGFLDLWRAGVRTDAWVTAGETVSYTCSLRDGRHPAESIALAKSAIYTALGINPADVAE